MQGTVFPRPHKWAVDRKGRRYKAPLRPHEEWTDPDTGTVTKAGPAGSAWTWQLTTGSKRRGDRRTHSKGGYPTKKTAQEALTEALAKWNKGDKRPLTVRRSTQTLGEHLDEWVAACEVRAKKPLKPSTAAGYRSAINAWIKPHVGMIQLANLDRDHLVALYRTLGACGGRPTTAEREAAKHEGRKVEGSPLGSRSVQLVHTILSKSLRSAVTSDKIPLSPVDHIADDDRPTHTPRKLENRHWTPAEAAAWLVHTASDRLHALDALALDSGARRGELAALRWHFLDLDAGVMKVRRNRVLVGGVPVEGTPKSETSERDIALHPSTVAVLKAWRRAQVTERLAAGEAWGVPDGIGDPAEREAAQAVNTAEGGYVFCDELGRPGSPEWLSDRFEQLQESFDARRLTFHGLRHTSATTALARLVPVHVVSARLGHSSVSVTYDIYAHVIPGQDGDAAAAIGDAIWAVAETGS